MAEPAVEPQAVYTLRRSAVDVRWVEILKDSLVVEEVAVCVAIRDFQGRFSSLQACLEWLREEEFRLAKRSVYQFVAARAYTRLDLEKKLRKKQFSQLAIHFALDEVERLGYLTGEDEQVKKIVSSELSRGYGPHYIERKLRARNRSDRVQIDQSAQISAIRKLLLKHKNKKYAENHSKIGKWQKGPADFVNQASGSVREGGAGKAGKSKKKSTVSKPILESRTVYGQWVRFLSRRGFDFDCICEALRELKNCVESEYIEHIQTNVDEDR